MVPSQVRGAVRPADTTGAAGAGAPGAERFKEVKGMKKRIVGTLMALLLAVTVLPQGAISVTSADVTTGLVTTAYAAEHQNHCICGAEHKTIGDHTSEEKPETWIGVSSLSDIKEDGYYYLTKDVELSSAWSANYRHNGGTGYDNNVVLCLNGHSIGQSRSDAVISVSRGCTITITDCAAEGKQGEIKHVEDKVNDNKIHFNHGVYVTYGTFNMYGGRITGNTTGYDSPGKGGGVYVGDGYSSSSNAVFNMYGGTITGNTADKGGAGGGVYVESGRTFNMYGGTISNNTADYGGGVYVEEGATFTMSGDANISANTAGTTTRGFGGGVYSKGTFNLNGGTITENTAISDGFTRELGGGVNSAGGKLNLSGNPVVKDNKKDTSSDNVKVDGGTMEVADALTEGACIIINSSNKSITPTDKSGVWYTWDEATNTLTAPTGSSGGETGGETTGHKHPVCGSSCTDSAHADETFQKWESTTSLPASGKYYLANNVTLARSHVVEGDLVLCLNGKTVTASDSITVTNGKTFTLTDCEPNGNKGVISRSSDTTSGEAGVRMVNGAHFVMYGGTIQNSWIGVEVIYESDGTFTMYGGTITGCKSSGVVVQETSNISILGGKITGNYTGMTVYGGALTIGGNANITGNTGEGNSARNVNFECQEITPITVRNDFTGSFGVTVGILVNDGTQIINGNGYNGTITCDNWGKVIDASGKLQQAPVENTYTVTFVVDSTTPWGTVAPSIVQNVPYGAEIKWNQANRGITVGEQSVAVTPQAEDAEYTYSVEAMRFERNVVTQNTTVTVVFGRTAKTGGETGGETPTPTPEAPRYYYSSGSGSTGAGGLSAVQNDPNGKSATDYNGGIYGLIFKSYANFSSFQGVQVDGKTIAPANYIAEEGSIEVYLKAVYLRTLAAGKHTVTILSSEGNATAEFTVGGVVSAPKTADAGALAYLGLALSSYVGTALVTRRKKEF